LDSSAVAQDFGYICEDAKPRKSPNENNACRKKHLLRKGNWYRRLASGCEKIHSDIVRPVSGHGKGYWIQQQQRQQTEEQQQQQRGMCLRELHHSRNPSFF